jgi:hypothetical protein
LQPHEIIWTEDCEIAHLARTITSTTSEVVMLSGPAAGKRKIIVHGKLTFLYTRVYVPEYTFNVQGTKLLSSFVKGTILYVSPGVHGQPLATVCTDNFKKVHCELFDLEAVLDKDDDLFNRS